MIRSRLSFTRLYLKIVTLLLPACAYFIAANLNFGVRRLWEKSPAGIPSYWGVLLITTIVWAITAEESGLWNVEQLYAPSGKSRRLLEAEAFTYAIVMVAGFLYGPASYSPLVIAFSAAVLFVLATITRVLFRVFLELMRRHGRNEVKILIVGTDRFAYRVQTSLVHGEVLPCRVVGFVRLTGQNVAVLGQIYELKEMPNFYNGK